MIAFTVVERPEPLRPSRLTISPSPTRSVDALQDVALAVVGVQVVDLEHRVMRHRAEIGFLHGALLAWIRAGVSVAMISP